MLGPYLGNTTKGWTSSIPVQIITSRNERGFKVEEIEEKTYQAEFQPVSPYAITRLPEEYRGRKIWAVSISDNELFLLPNNIIVDPKGIRYRIKSSTDWREAGYTDYLVEADYDK